MNPVISLPFSFIMKTLILITGQYYITIELRYCLFLHIALRLVFKINIFYNFENNHFKPE